MSFSRKAGGDLLRAYDHSLELQIVEQGSSLPCRDEELWKKAEGLLRDGNAQEMHCLGVDPLNVMEESLKAVTAAGCSRQMRTRGGLRGLAKAFEVLEQAAVNLYLGPWRKEYSVIQMYSGTFAHCITPVLSMPQVENLFGLLGYQPSPSSSELLRLQSHAVSPTSADDFLRLSCAAFLARCECHLLTSALGKHSGDTQWELSAVLERQRGNSLQVAVDNTRKMLEVSEQTDGEVDLYGDEEANGGEQQVVLSNDKSPCSVIWEAQRSALPPAVETHSNGSSSPLRESHTSRSSSDSKMLGRRSRGEKKLEEAHSDPHSLQLEPVEPHRDEDMCSCVLDSDVCSYCADCDALHSVTCAGLQVCKENGHVMKPMKEAEQSGGLRSPGLSSGSVAALPLSEDPASITPPPRAISYHVCCDLTKLDPQILCRTCRVFHCRSCREFISCRSMHDSSVLGKCCLCQKWCSRKPLVLCRYCGREYCNGCWYRNPLTCGCGQTFDQSSSV